MARTTVDDGREGSTRLHAQGEGALPLQMVPTLGLATDQRPASEQVVTLASNLLPSLPSSRPGSTALGGSSSSSSAVRAGAERSEALAADHVARVAFLADNPALLQGFAQGLLPLMLEARLRIAMVSRAQGTRIVMKGTLEHDELMWNCLSPRTHLAM